MKIYDITKIACQNTIKPVLNTVCVKHINEHQSTYVATDAFRIVEITSERLPLEEGLYSLDSWKLLCKDINNIKIVKPLELGETYPDYSKLLPQSQEDLQECEILFNNVDIYLFKDLVDIYKKVKKTKAGYYTIAKEIKTFRINGNGNGKQIISILDGDFKCVLMPLQ